MKKRVVSLELAIQLHKAGFPQNTEFSWWEVVDRDDTPRLNWTDENRDNSLPTQSWERKHAAPLADEILEQLPEKIKEYKSFLIGKWENKWVISYERIGYSLQAIRFDDPSLADAAAKCWLYLKEQKLL